MMNGPLYVFAAIRGRSGRKHIVEGGALRQRGSFKTLCGLWGNSNEVPWTVGQVRRNTPGWCRRCLRSRDAA